MKQRIRIGLRLSLPFGLFKNGGIFVVYGDFSKMKGKIDEVKELLYSFGNPQAQEFADRLVCEKG